MRGNLDIWKEMNKNEKITRKSLSCYKQQPEDGFMELNQEDKEMYLFLRGGFAAK